MVSSINLKMDAIGMIYLKIFHHIQRFFGIINSGENKKYLQKSWLFCMVNCEQQSKKTKWTTLIIIDSQAVKNTCNASIESKGFCFYKSTNGINRHLAVDTLGCPFFTHCTRVNLSDDAGLIEMLTHNIDYFKSKPVNIPKITIFSGQWISSRQINDRAPKSLSQYHK